MMYLTRTQQTKNINLIFVSFKMGGYVNILRGITKKPLPKLKLYHRPNTFENKLCSIFQGT